MSSPVPRSLGQGEDGGTTNGRQKLVADGRTIDAYDVVLVGEGDEHAGILCGVQHDSH